MRAVLFVAVAALMISCEPDPPVIRRPNPAPPAAPIVAPPPAPTPRNPAKFEGTWMTDQGVLIIFRDPEHNPSISGIFLPINRPASYFRVCVEGDLLGFGAMDGKPLWNALLRLVDGGRGIEGQIWVAESQDKLPCRGKRVGDSAQNGVPALLASLESSDVWVRRSAVQALGALGPAARRAIPSLVFAMRDPDPEVSRAAGASLARLGAPPADMALELTCHLRDEVPAVRAAAANALGRMNADGALALSDLLVLLEAPDALVKPSALQAVVGIGSAVPSALAAALSGAEPAVLGEVLRALGTHHRTEALSALTRELREEQAKASAKAILSSSVVRAPTAPDSPGEDWPYWRGPRKDNVSRETGLLKKWPEEGPPLAWEVWGVGAGIAGPSVRNGRIFVLGHLGGWEYLTALKLESGECLWTVRLGPGDLEDSHMRWVAQRTPSTDNDRVFAYLNSGQLVCLRAADGVEQWRVDYPKMFGERIRNYGYTDHPFIDGGRLICTPASSKATLAALDPATGKVLWSSKGEDACSPAPSTIAVDLDGVRQYVVSAYKLLGFSEDGKVLWTVAGNGSNYMVTTALASGSWLLWRPCGSPRDLTILEVTRPGKVNVKIARKQSFGWLQDSNLVFGKFLYVPVGDKIERHSIDSGDRQSVEHGTGNESSMICADGRMVVLGNRGRVGLIDLSAREMAFQSNFTIPMFVQSSGTSNPVIARGRLLIRDNDRILCYDIRENVPPGERTSRAVRSVEPPAPPRQEGPPKAAFVPTPSDVVPKMIEMADVKFDELLIDLGSGDGRILVAAATGTGVRALGYEIDEALVKASRLAATEAGSAARIRIEQQDLFTADLSKADAVTVYLPEELLTRLKPQLAKLKPGARIVSHEFKIPGVPPDKEVTVVSLETGKRHKVYLWTAPLKEAGK